MRKALFASVVAAIALAGLPVPAASAAPIDAPARRVEPVVLTGAQLPSWSRLPAQGMAKPYPSGALDGVRDAHNGTIVVPPDARTGVAPEDVVAYRYENGEFSEIPVQVDERFPYFLANANSDFGMYSGTDEELSYEWDVESWRKTAGQCEAQYPNADDRAMEDPVATFDDDDELVFMADDAGAPAPAEALGPVGTYGDRMEVRLNDSFDPTAERYVYLFLRAGGSSFDADNGYVDYQRDANADQWIDRTFFADDDPEKLGTSNTGYGPNLSGTVCHPTLGVKNSTDRFPRDGVTVSTDSYRWRATGRWMVREMSITKPGTTRAYGPDLIDRWKGRAFQQSPDSEISVVGFEDEQVNWEGNSTLLGELEGPVRAIRETWGADSGTNVTKTETFYRDSIAYRYRVRVHPIPPDGLYTSWDYNRGVAATYYNETKAEGVAIDGVNDDVGQVDDLGGRPAYFDAPDPTFTKPLAFLNWEQVSGAGDSGSLVYIFEMKNAQALANPLVTPYYRDDACLDDGTGDDPSPRQMPGDTLSDEEKLPCVNEAPAGYNGPFQQGAFGSHGIHYFITGDTDNAFTPAKVNEIDGQQWQFAVPTAAPTNVGDAYANTVKVPLVPVVTAQSNTAAPAQDETSLAITSAASGSVNRDFTFTAELTGPEGGIAGEPVSFFLRNETLGSATTNDSGIASLTTRLAGPVGAAELRAEYGGNESYLGSSATQAFEVTKAPSTTTITSPSSGRVGRTFTFKADLTSGTPLAGQTLVFYLNGTEIGRSTTNEAGGASVVKKLDFGTGSYELRVTYAGNAEVEASSAKQSFRVTNGAGKG